MPALSHVQTEYLCGPGIRAAETLGPDFSSQLPRIQVPTRHEASISLPGSIRLCPLQLEHANDLEAQPLQGNVEYHGNITSNIPTQTP